MAFSGIQGHKLEIAVVGCNQLKDTWYGQHKPYVSLIYGTTSHRTKTSTANGGKNPTFNEKFEFTLIEGLHELIVNVFSSHDIMDSYIGCGNVKIDEVFREGYHITLVPLRSLTGRQAGEVSLILHYYPNPNVHPQQGANSLPSYASPGLSPYPPPYGVQPSSPPQGSPTYPPQYGAQMSSPPPQGSPIYHPQYAAQLSSAPQRIGSPIYPPPYGVQPYSPLQGSPTYPPQYGAQMSSPPQGSPIYPPQYAVQLSSAPQRIESPIYPPQYEAHPSSESPGSSLSHSQVQDAPAHDPQTQEDSNIGEDDVQMVSEENKSLIRHMEEELAQMKLAQMRQMIQWAKENSAAFGRM